MTPKFVFVAAIALAVSSAFGQTGGPRADSDRVAVARCAYASGESCQSRNSDGAATTVAQGPRRMPPHGRGPMVYPGPRYGYPGYGMGDGHPGHALIGAVLLGGLGGSLAYNTHPNGQTQPNVVGALFCGGLGGVIGWVIGYHLPFEHSPRFHRRSWPDEDEEASRHSDRGPGSGPTQSAARTTSNVGQ